MSTVYKKIDRQKRRQIVRFFGLCLSLFGFVIMVYLTYPLLSWKLFNEPAFANQGVTAPIPRTTVLDRDSLKSLFVSTVNTLRGVDYTNANNWYPSYLAQEQKSAISTYFLTIPKLRIKNAIVSAVNTNLSKNLVHYPGTSIPPDKGTAVIFGHSTLPQLFDPTNYDTIFATLHTLKVGDVLITTVGNVTYTYRIFSITITTPDDVSVLEQDFSDSYITLITCTPPGTTWKRLIIKSRLELL